MPCTSLCSSGGRLMRRTSPCTRIIGGRPADRCRSDALFLTDEGEQLGEIHYNSSQVAAKDISSLDFSDIMTAIADNLQAVRARIGRAAQGRSSRCGRGDIAGGVQDPPRRAHRRGARRRASSAFGENYVQEALAEDGSACRRSSGTIGPLQSNKTRARRRALRLGADRRP